MRSIVVAEICCLLVLWIIATGVMTKNFVKDRRTKWFIAFIFAGFMSVSIDIASYYMNEGFPALFVNALSYTMGSLTIIPYTYYIHAVINRVRRLSLWYVHPITIAATLNAIHLFVAGITGQLFSTDPETYGQGEFPIWSEALYFLSMIYTPLLAFLKGRQLGIRALFAIGSYVVFPFISEVVGVINETAETYTIAACALSLFYMYVMLQNNITEEMVTEHKLELMLARVDALTGIGNRYVGADEINERIQARRPFVMMILDVDKFKYINDTFGHPVGDRVLKEIAMVLKEEFADEGVPVRLGGDEFMVIIDGEKTKEELNQKIKHLFASINQIKVAGMALDHKVQVSVGTAEFDGRNDYSFDDLYHITDQRLYESKKHIGSYCTSA